MIEWLETESGGRVVRCDGRLLASRMDPGAEAKAWLDRRAPFIDRVKCIFVLGAGSGTHLAELANRTHGRILVIEARADLIEAVRPTLAPWRERMEWIHVSSAKELRALDGVRRAVEGSFLVLEHPPSVSLAAEFYRECAKVLRGREWGALTWQWKLKGLPELDANPRITTNDRTLTIYDLEQTELVQNSAERERLLLLALRELVK